MTKRIPGSLFLPGIIVGVAATLLFQPLLKQLNSHESAAHDAEATVQQFLESQSSGQQLMESKFLTGEALKEYQGALEHTDPKPRPQEIQISTVTEGDCIAQVSSTVVSSDDVLHQTFFLAKDQNGWKIFRIVEQGLDWKAKSTVLNPNQEKTIRDFADAVSGQNLVAVTKQLAGPALINFSKNSRLPSCQIQIRSIQGVGQDSAGGVLALVHESVHVEGHESSITVLATLAEVHDSWKIYDIHQVDVK